MRADPTFLRLSKEGRETSFLRTARKPWVCVQCSIPIAVGDRYVEYMAESEPRYGATGARTCLNCAEKNGWVEEDRVSKAWAERDR